MEECQAAFANKELEAEHKSAKFIKYDALYHSYICTAQNSNHEYVICIEKWKHL